MNINRLCKRTATVGEYNLLDCKPRRGVSNQASARRKLQDSSPEPGELTLEQEIDLLKKDEVWLDELRQLYSMDNEHLQNRLDEFKSQCIADGKEHHQSEQDAKQHFNSWLRIILKKGHKDVKDKTVGRDRRKGNVLKSDEKKTYGDSF